MLRCGFCAFQQKAVVTLKRKRNKEVLKRIEKLTIVGKGQILASFSRISLIFFLDLQIFS